MRPRPTVMLVPVAVGAGLGLFSYLGDGRVSWRVFDIIANLAAPWGLAAFVIGRKATSPLRGARAGGIALVVGVATYYALGAASGYATSATNLVWTAIALVVGPVMGLCGAVVASGSGRALVAAAAAPSVMLLAEAAYVIYERRAWLWNVQREPYRIIDLAVIVTFIAVAIAVPLLLLEDRSRLRIVYPAVLVAGLIGAGAFVWLQSFMVSLTQVA